MAERSSESINREFTDAVGAQIKELCKSKNPDGHFNNDENKALVNQAVIDVLSKWREYDRADDIRVVDLKPKIDANHYRY